MKTTYPKKTDIDRKWYLVDAKDLVLGRISTKIADLLRGKNKPLFSPHLDCGDYVVVINTKDVRLTGKKEEQKEYIHHTEFPGGLRRKPIARMRVERPNEIIKRAVAGMIPRNRLKKDILSKLKLFEGAEHDHEAQKPQKLELNA